MFFNFLLVMFKVFFKVVLFLEFWNLKIFGIFEKFIFLVIIVLENVFWILVIFWKCFEKELSFGFDYFCNKLFFDSCVKIL